MRIGTFCSGILAPEVAWAPLGWEPVFFSEIEPFPIAVQQHHYPNVPNLGDMEHITDETLRRYPVELICAGTPCQAFSVAGLRKGLDDPRGNLTLVLLRLVNQLRPLWVVWENVPGVLSIDGGRAFGAFLGGLAELGYGFAYRVLDAQHFGVPQRRRRVFVVGCLGDWRRAAAVLFERHSLSGHPAPSREAGQGTAADVAQCIRGDGAGTSRIGDTRGQDNVVVGNDRVAPTLDAHYGDKCGLDNQHINSGAGLFITHSLRADGFDASDDGTGRGTPLIPVAFDTTQVTSVANYSNPKPGDPCHPLAAGAHPPAIIPIDMRQASRGATMTNNRGEGKCSGGAPGTGIGEAGDPSPSLSTSHAPAVAFGWNKSPSQSMQVSDVTNPLQGSPTSNPAVAFQERGREGGRSLEHQTELAYSLNAPNGGGRRQELNVAARSGVRRLTPRECERLQGFPDDWTRVPFRNKPAADGPRYRAIGNSMAVPVVRWIGKRIQMVNAIGGVR